MLVGLFNLYTIIIQPLLDYTEYNNTLISYYLDNDLFEIHEDAIGIARDNVRIHRTIHDSEGVLLCEEANNSACFVSSNLMVCSVKFYNSIPLIEGSMPTSENEIVVSENVSKSLRLKVGDLIELKNFLLLKNLTISGITKNLYGFPNDYNPHQLNVVILGDSKINWQSFKPFFSFSVSMDITNSDRNMREMRSFKNISNNLTLCLKLFYFSLFAITAIFSILIKSCIGLNQYIKHQIILGKTLMRRRLISIYTEIVIGVVLGSICLILLQFSSADNVVILVVMFVFLIETLFLYLRMK